MNERMPKQPNQNWQNYLGNFNKNQYIKIKITNLKDNIVRLEINKSDTKFAFIKTDVMLEIDKEKTEEIIKWIKEWEKEIKKYEKGRNLIESAELTVDDLIEIRKIDFKKMGLILEIKELDENIEARLTDPTIPSGIIFIFNNKEDTLEYMDHILDHLKRSEGVSNFIEQIESVDTNEFDIWKLQNILKQIEAKNNEYLKAIGINDQVFFNLQLNEKDKTCSVVIKDKGGNIVNQKNFRNIQEALKESHYVIKNADEVIKQRIDEMRKINTEELKKSTNLKELLKEVEDKFNEKYKGEQIRIELCDDGKIIVHTKTQNKGWEATSKEEYENFDKFAKWIRSLKLM